MARAGRVQQLAGGMPPLRQLIVVVALSPDPFSRGQALPCREGGQPPPQLLPAGALPQAGLEEGVGIGGQVAVGVHKGREQGPPLQVHPAHSPFRSFLRAVQTAGVEDPLPLCQQRLDIELPLHRDDRPSKIQCLRHK